VPKYALNRSTLSVTIIRGYNLRDHDQKTAELKTGEKQYTNMTNTVKTIGIYK
jgi:hypothetical protein